MIDDEGFAALWRNAQRARAEWLKMNVPGVEMLIIIVAQISLLALIMLIVFSFGSGLL